MTRGEFLLGQNNLKQLAYAGALPVSTIKGLEIYKDFKQLAEQGNPIMQIYEDLAEKYKHKGTSVIRKYVKTYSESFSLPNSLQ